MKLKAVNQCNILWGFSFFMLGLKKDRSAFVFVVFSLAKGGFVGKIGGKIRFAKKEKVKNCENSVFWVVYVKKKKKSLGSGPFPRNGRVTGNKRLLFYRPYSMFSDI